MRQMSFKPVAIAHSCAAGASLYYAWFVSHTAYVKTGLQFIAPLLVILSVHLCWVAVTRGLAQGFSLVVFRRTAQSSIAMAAALLLWSLAAPQPAAASGIEALQSLLAVGFCVAIVVAVGAVLAAIGYILFKGCRAIINAVQGGGTKGPDSRLFDFGSMAVAVSALCLCSLEGMPSTYSFGAANRSEATQIVKATPGEVWLTMETATSPNFPLPEALAVFPQPVDVVIDEGVTLGAMRKVKFKGREGVGYLTLQVVERTQTTAVFEVLSDSSPIARWVGHRRLIYTVTPEGEGTRVSVALEYDRLLAPSWFFTPLTKGAAYLAMDVLARDVATRAQG